MNKIIHISTIKNNSYVPTSATCEAYTEAAAVCLEFNKHKQNVLFKIKGDFSGNIELIWNKVSASIKASWNDLEEATEYGATALAILLLKELTDYKIIRRSRKRTGIDYWLGSKDDDFPFQDKGRLEVSGILKGSKSQVNQRVKQKKEQTKQSDHKNLEAIIIVIEFSNPLAKIEIR